MKALVTGGAGFIGSHLVDRLLQIGNKVIVLDNLTSGSLENLKKHFDNPHFKFFNVDLVRDNILRYFKDVDEVWHLAANANVRAALENTKIDLKQNLIATYRV